MYFCIFSLTEMVLELINDLHLLSFCRGWFVEAKFGLRIRDSKPSDTGSRGYSDPMDIHAINSLAPGKRKGSSSPRDGCFKRGSSF